LQIYAFSLIRTSKRLKKGKKIVCYEIKYYLCGEKYKMAKHALTASKEFAALIAVLFAGKRH